MREEPPIGRGAFLGREPFSESVRVDEVGERARAVYLDDGEQLAVAGLELGIALDVDELELEAELRLHLAEHLERTLAEVAVRGVVEPDDGYG